MAALAPALAEVVEGASPSLWGATIYFEYGMPGSSSLADALLAGRDARGQPAAVVVELKQWDAGSITDQGRQRRVGGRVHPHPCEQALDYREYLAELGAALPRWSVSDMGRGSVDRVPETHPDDLRTEPAGFSTAA